MMKILVKMILLEGKIKRLIVDLIKIFNNFRAQFPINTLIDKDAIETVNKYISI
jgi:hypothetical protein